MRKALAIITALTGALALAGCTSGGDMSAVPGSYNESSMTDAGVGVVEGATLGDEFGATEFGSTEFGAADSSADGVRAADANTDRQVISTGFATITADDPIAAANDAAQIVSSAGGRVDARSEQAPVDGSRGQATLTLRIPSAVFEQTLDELKELGRDISVETSANDVTTQTQDLDARIAALSTSVDRLLGLLASADTTADLIEIETALSSRQAELDSLQTQRRALSDQVSMATLTLSLVSEAEAPPRAPDTFWDSLVAGLAGFAAFFTATFLALGYAVPWLLLFAALLFGYFAIIRARKRRAAAAETAAAASVAAEANTESPEASVTEPEEK